MKNVKGFALAVAAVLACFTGCSTSVDSTNPFDPEDGAIPSGSITWDLEQCASVLQSVGGDWNFPTPNQDCTWMESLGNGSSVQRAIANPGWYRVWLTATDGAGQQGRTYVDLKIVP
ncbi:MAG: hypothetical protein HY897_00440 [Deltaproteobacteria bacterium]|nr:hypothetical protein [Deltaproteobacteria bacterium]